MASNDLMVDLITAIRHRLTVKVTDLGGHSSSRLRPGNPNVFENDERQLGFKFPSLLKQAYAEIGNGGFGPGYGLYGLTGGAPNDLGYTAPADYQLFRQPDSEEEKWSWPFALLPICHWGCAIISCIDCSDSDFRMRIFDPNFHEGNDWSDSFFEECESFQTWISDWAAGVELWDRMYGQEGYIYRILSARRPERA